MATPGISPSSTSPEGCWRSLIDHGSFFVATFSRDGRLTFLNRHPTDDPIEPLIGRPLAEVFGLAAGEDTGSLLRRVVEEGEVRRIEAPNRSAEHQMGWLEWRLLPITESGEVVGVLALGRDITEAKQIALELRMTINALHRTIEAREQLAADLHDGTLQSLYGIGLRLQAIRAIANIPEPIEAHLDRAIEVTGVAMAQIRRYLTDDMAPPQFSYRWDEALTGLLRGLEIEGGPTLSIELDRKAVETIPERWRGDLAFVAREAVSNAIRHAKASHISVRLNWPDGLPRLEIRDDGVGFRDSATRRGFGLLTMTRRAAQVGGILTIQTAPERGTAIRLELPAIPDSAHA